MVADIQTERKALDRNTILDGSEIAKNVFYNAGIIEGSIPNAL